MTDVDAVSLPYVAVIVALPPSVPPAVNRPDDTSMVPISPRSIVHCGATGRPLIVAAYCTVGIAPGAAVST